MKNIKWTICLAALGLILSVQCHSQTNFQENFDIFTSGQSIGGQSTDFQPISGVIGGADDPLVSSEQSQSLSNSLKIVNGDDVYYDFGGVTSGSYSIQFSLFIEEDGYFNLQHQKEIGWACDVYLTSSNEILYQDQSGSGSAIVVGNYDQDTWITFRFEVDIDSDIISLYKDDTLLHTSVFSNAIVGSTSNKLDVIDFYGLSGFQGVNTSLFYVDDFSVVENPSSAGEIELEAEKFTVYPNPSEGDITIDFAILQGENVSIKLVDLDGRIIYSDIINNQVGAYQKQLNISELAEGMYLLKIDTNTESVTKRIVKQ